MVDYTKVKPGDRVRLISLAESDEAIGFTAGQELPILEVLAEYIEQGTRSEDKDAEIARLRALVNECLDVIEQVPDDIQFWADYASDYYQTKHKLAGFISRYTDFLDKHRPAPPEAQEGRG